MTQPENSSMAVFCDFENVALGVAEAKYDKFDIGRVIERLLFKGSIVVKKAYCDWERYKSFKAVMHEAAFELIEIPHIRMSGKNSADIRMVVDALDLCYTKNHVDTFVIISGDSDFSPLVSKLRENAKTVIGVGVRNSTSELLTRNCDEFIFYDDLVKPKNIGTSTKGARTKKKTPRKQTLTEQEKLEQEGFNVVLETIEALANERGGAGRIWGSMVKQTLKRRWPGFTEPHYGFSGFNDMLEKMHQRKLLAIEHDERSGGYVIKEWSRN